MELAQSFIAYNRLLAWKSSIRRLLHIKSPIVPVALLAVYLALSGCAATATRRSVGEAIADSAITATVKAALVADPATKARRISVKTYRDVVQLSGFVSSATERDAAARVAAHQAGVRGVDDELEIKFSTQAARYSDYEITARVKAALLANPAANAHYMNVTTSSGVVELSGFVDNNGQRDTADRVANGVQGVRKIDNRLAIKPAIKVAVER